MIIKVFQLADGCFQVNLGIVPLISTYVGNIDFIKDMILNFYHGATMPYEIIPIAGVPGAVYQNCLHQYVEMGFTSSRMICKLCDVQKV